MDENGWSTANALQHCFRTWLAAVLVRAGHGDRSCRIHTRLHRHQHPVGGYLQHTAQNTHSTEHAHAIMRL